MYNTILMSNVDNDRGYVCVGTGGMWEISVSPSSFVVNLELVYKKKSIKKVWWHDDYNSNEGLSFLK